MKKLVTVIMFIFMFFPMRAVPQTIELPDILLSLPERVNQGDFFKIEIRNKNGKKLPASNYSVIVHFPEESRIYFCGSFPANEYMHMALIPVQAEDKPGKARIVVIGNYQYKEVEIEIQKKDFPEYKKIIHKRMPTESQLRRRAEEVAELKKIYASSTPRMFFNEKPSFHYPLKNMPTKENSTFALIRHIRVGNGEIEQRRHWGIDYAVPKGTPVLAAEAGIVRLSKNLSGSGNTVIIDHGYKLYSLYLHLSRFKVKKDAEVKAGQVIGYSGNTGASRGKFGGYHLDFRTNIGGVWVNPNEFFGGER